MTEDNTVKVNYHDFAEVIRELKKDPERKAQRNGWNGKGLTIRIVDPASTSANPKLLPYLVLEYPKPTDGIGGTKIGSDLYPNGACVPWLASQTDILAEDWIIL